MHNKPETLEFLTKSLEIVKKLPSDVYFNLGYDGRTIQIEAATMEEVKKVRSRFRGIVWEKKYQEWAEYWVYTGKTTNGVSIRITGCKDAPARCKMIEVTETTKERVPVQYEEREVTRTRVKYECPPDRTRKVS